ncbi:MAG: rod shape-determining protein RodA [Thermoleophilia bacterium]|nr:rod shape-determining protein RodA [Thermoleophilia bacterium]
MDKVLGNILRGGMQARRSPGFSLGGYLRSLDWILLGATLGLVTYGFLMLYSATHTDPTVDTPFYYVRSQSVGLILGLVLLFALSMIDYRRFKRFQVYIYGACLLLLVLTLLIGSGGEDVGARRWLEYGPLRLQTAELVKFLLILGLGAVLVEGAELRGRFRFVVLCVVYMFIPGVLIFLQPDLGTSLVLVAILLSMLVVWGIRLTHLGALLGAGAFGAVLVLRVLPTAFGVNLLQDWQLRRLTVFLNPEKDALGAGYQLIQSRIAIGSGMFSGKGYLQGTQHNLAFLPERHTDFIFAVIGEELGFVGGVLLLGLFALVVWRAFRISRMAQDLYGQLIAAGIAGVIVFQVFVNVGMTIGIMPVTGLPLPFISFGSSSLVVFLMAIGLLESVNVHSVAGMGRQL